jgi:hypothetical protein
MAHGAVRLGEVADTGKETLVIVCEPCGRIGRYSVAGLLKAHGHDATLPDLLAYLTRSCVRPQVSAHHRRCEAMYERRTRMGLEGIKSLIS